MEITKDMISFYEKRTKKHISLVDKYCIKASKVLEELSQRERFSILSAGKTHDNSKYSKEEREPYILLTHKYRMLAQDEKISLTEEQKKGISDAIDHHYSVNNHHTHYYGKIGDKGDGRKMGKVALIEMLCDWCAMSEEKDGNPIEWGRTNIKKRFIFTEDQKNLIFQILPKLWK